MDLTGSTWQLSGNYRNKKRGKCHSDRSGGIFWIKSKDTSTAVGITTKKMPSDGFNGFYMATIRKL
jgi:hypothetical protein